MPRLWNSGDKLVLGDLAKACPFFFREGVSVKTWNFNELPILLSFYIFAHILPKQMHTYFPFKWNLTDWEGLLEICMLIHHFHFPLDSSFFTLFKNPFRLLLIQFEGVFYLEHKPIFMQLNTRLIIYRIQFEVFYLWFSIPIDLFQRKWLQLNISEHLIQQWYRLNGKLIINFDWGFKFSEQVIILRNICYNFSIFYSRLIKVREAVAWRVNNESCMIREHWMSSAALIQKEVYKLKFWLHLNFNT